jgi:hypothetical protein
LKQFLQDVFHNYLDVLRPHRELLDKLYEIQREEHPQIRSITAPVFDAALNWTDAYMEYIPHHPIATYRVDDELANNLDFKKFIEVSLFFVVHRVLTDGSSIVPDIQMHTNLTSRALLCVPSLDF